MKTGTSEEREVTHRWRAETKQGIRLEGGALERKQGNHVTRLRAGLGTGDGGCFSPRI